MEKNRRRHKSPGGRRGRDRMNAQKFTQKSLEAIREAQNLTVEHQNMQLEQELSLIHI